MEAYQCFLAGLLLFASQVDAECITETNPRFPDFTVALCDGGAVEDLDRIPANIMAIGIKAISIGHITKPLLPRFAESLKGFACQRCQLTDIEENAFSGMKKLVLLNLDKNNLTSVKARWFRDSTLTRRKNRRNR